MVFNSFAKQNFYPQTGNFSFQQTLILNNITGKLECGFSGSGKFSYFFKSGKFIDHRNNFLDVYSANNSITLSGNVSSTTVDYYLNGRPLSYGGSRPTGSLNYFYVNPQNCTVTSDLFINGDMPFFSVTNNIVYLINQPLIPVYIANHSALPFRVFSGQMVTDPTRAHVSSLPTGEIFNIEPFYIVQNHITGKNTFIINLYTNFGTEQLAIEALGI